MQRIIRDYYMQLHANNIKHLENMDKFFKKYSPQRLNQEEVEIMNNPITSTEFEAVTKNLPKKQKPRTRWLHRKILLNI